METSKNLLTKNPLKRVTPGGNPLIRELGSLDQYEPDYDAIEKLYEDVYADQRNKKADDE